jgi:hypothetical protein
MSGRLTSAGGRVLGAATLLAAVCLSLSGCTPVADQLRSAVDEGVSSTASSALAVKLADQGLALAPLTDTVLSDSLTELQKAETAVTEVKPSATESAARARVLEAIQNAMDAVLGAREDVASGSDLGGAADDLATANDALQALQKSLQ